MDDKIFWDLPMGKLVRFNNKDELCTFLNKTQLHYETESFSNDQAFGISIRFDEEREEYCCEFAKTDDDCFVIPIHDKNPYMDEDKQIAGNLTNYNYIKVKVEDIELDERWVFPCNVYIWLEDTMDRMGDVQVKLFQVFPIGSELTVDDFKKEEERIADSSISQYKKFVDLQEKRERLIDPMNWM